MKNKDYIIGKLKDLRDETPCIEDSQTACGCEKFDEIIDLIKENLLLNKKQNFMQKWSGTTYS